MKLIVARVDELDTIPGRVGSLQFEGGHFGDEGEELLPPVSVVAVGAPQEQSLLSLHLFHNLIYVIPASVLYVFWLQNAADPLMVFDERDIRI